MRTHFSMSFRLQRMPPAAADVLTGISLVVACGSTTLPSSFAHVRLSDVADDVALPLADLAAGHPSGSNSSRCTSSSYGAPRRCGRDFAGDDVHQIVVVVAASESCARLQMREAAMMSARVNRFGSGQNIRSPAPSRSPLLWISRSRTCISRVTHGSCIRNCGR